MNDKDLLTEYFTGVLADRNWIYVCLGKYIKYGCPSYLGIAYAAVKTGIEDMDTRDDGEFVDWVGDLVNLVADHPGLEEESLLMAFYAYSSVPKEMWHFPATVKGLIEIASVAQAHACNHSEEWALN